MFRDDDARREIAELRLETREWRRELEQRMADIEAEGALEEQRQRLADAERDIDTLEAAASEGRASLAALQHSLYEAREKLAEIKGRMSGQGPTVNVTAQGGNAQSHGDQHINEGASGAQGKIGEMNG